MMTMSDHEDLKKITMMSTMMKKRWNLLTLIEMKPVWLYPLIERSTKNTLLTLGLASVKRAPSSVELFMNGAHLATGRFEVGDVTLESETSNNIDLTFDYENNGFFATATIFRNDVDDYIYLLDESEEEHEMHEEDDHDEDHDDHDGHDDHDDHDGHDDHGGLILSNYMQKDAEFNGYEFELGRSVNVNGGSMSFSYGMDYVNAKFKDGGYVPRINPRRHIFSIDYAKEGYKSFFDFKKCQISK